MKEALRSLGLSEGEVTVYLTLLQLGPSTNSPIARHAELQSSSTYYCLNSLIEKGMVTYVRKGGRKLFSAADPKSLPALLDEQMQVLEKKKEQLQTIVPQLEAKKETYKDKTFAEVYEGKDGVRAVFREILLTLKKGEFYRGFVVEQAVDDSVFLRDVFTHHNKALYKKGVGLRLLSPKSLEKTYTKIYGKAFMKTYQTFKYTDEKIPVGITIYKNIVLTHITDAGKPVIIKVRNKELAKRYGAYFDDVWKRS